MVSILSICGPHLVVALSNGCDYALGTLFDNWGCIWICWLLDWSYNLIEAKCQTYHEEVCFNGESGSFEVAPINPSVGPIYELQVAQITVPTCIQMRSDFSQIVNGSTFVLITFKTQKSRHVLWNLITHILYVNNLTPKSPQWEWNLAQNAGEKDLNCGFCFPEHIKRKQKSKSISLSFTLMKFSFSKRRVKTRFHFLLGSKIQNIQVWPNKP